MSKAKKVLVVNSILMALLLLSIFFFDKPIAGLIARYATPIQRFFFGATALLDSFSTYIAWLLLASLVVGTLLVFGRKTRTAGFVLLTLVVVHVLASVATSTMKTGFQRARPEVYLQQGGQNADFYNSTTRDYSFPSSHTSFYLSLFLPAALAFRRWAPLLLLIPGIVTLGRVVQNEHYLSDVLCSVLIVFNLCFLIFHLLCAAERLRSNPPKMLPLGRRI